MRPRLDFLFGRPADDLNAKPCGSDYNAIARGSRGVTWHVEGEAATDTKASHRKLPYGFRHARGKQRLKRRLIFEALHEVNRLRAFGVRDRRDAALV